MNKFILALLTLVSLNAFATDCMTREAQFIGKVTDHSSASCTFKIELTMFNPHVLCPLDSDEVISARFEDKTCTLEDGAQVSGVLVKNDYTGNLIID